MQFVHENPTKPYYGVDIPYDGSGLIVRVRPGTAKGTLRGPLLALNLLPAADILVRESPVPRLTGRLNDTPPFYGGGRIKNNEIPVSCTAGFAVENSAGSYMLTAGHCGRLGETWNNGNDSRFFGYAASENVGHDLLLIVADVEGRMWDGGAISGSFTKTVAGWGYVVGNEYLCSSGSVSGAICNFRSGTSFTHSYCATDPYGNRECYSDLITAVQQDGRQAARGGDSGGPVFSHSGSRVIAKGIISGAAGTTLVFQVFATARRDFGIDPVIGG